LDFSYKNISCPIYPRPAWHNIRNITIKTTQGAKTNGFKNRGGQKKLVLKFIQGAKSDGCNS
jgi:hypothetical protein